MPVTRDEAETAARRILALSAADGCRVWMNGYAAHDLRLASRGGGSNGTREGVGVTVTANFGRRQGRATTDSLEDADLREVVARAEAAARLAPENPEAMPPPGPQRYPGSAAHVEATAGLGIDGLADLLAPAVRQTRQSAVDIAAFAQAGRSWRAYASSGGALVHDRATRIRLTVTARNRRGTMAGWAGAFLNDARRVDGAALAERAIEKASAQPDPAALEPGKYVVLLEPAVVAEMLSWMIGRFGARPADEGRSFLARKGGGNRQGDKMFDDRVTIASDPADPVVPGFSFGDDGMPADAVTWIDGGVVKTLARGRYWALKTGTDPVPERGFFTMRGGADTVADMIGGVKRGVLVTRLWYVRLVDGRSLTLTGLTRDGTFLIEDGAVTRPVNNFRFNESPVAMLNNILAIGPVESGYTPGVPPLLVKDFTFSSISPAV